MAEPPGIVSDLTKGGKLWCSFHLYKSTLFPLFSLKTDRRFHSFPPFFAALLPLPSNTKHPSAGAIHSTRYLSSLYIFHPSLFPHPDVCVPVENTYHRDWELPKRFHDTREKGATNIEYTHITHFFPGRMSRLKACFCKEYLKECPFLPNLIRDVPPCTR